MPFQGIPYTEMPRSEMKKKTCVVCGEVFVPRSGVQKACTKDCSAKAVATSGRRSTANQYKEISGNWDRYLLRLLRKRPQLSVDILKKVLKRQNGKCAISGVPLTCKLEVGTKCKTNASIDRIVAGKEYSIDNIQLVCAAVNSWRADTDLQDFIWWCKQVTLWQENKE